MDALSKNFPATDWWSVKQEKSSRLQKLIFTGFKRVKLRPLDATFHSKSHLFHQEAFQVQSLQKSQHVDSKGDSRFVFHVPIK